MSNQRYPIRLQSRHQHGFAAIAAVFLVVVLAALGTFMVTFSNTQNITSAQDVQGSRAFWAARAGLQWAVVAVPANPALCANAAPTLIGGAAPGTVDGFTLQIRCAKSDYLEGGLTRSIYRLESRAFVGVLGSIGFVERSLSVSLEVGG